MCAPIVISLHVYWIPETPCTMLLVHVHGCVCLYIAVCVCSDLTVRVITDNTSLVYKMEDYSDVFTHTWDIPTSNK